MFRVMIVDDEEPARRRLRKLLKPVKDLEIVGEFGEGETFVSACRSVRPDLVFLDIQMPGMSGFEALKSIPEAERPRVVFVTAYDEFALEAFRVHACDYIVKPTDEQSI